MPGASAPLAPSWRGLLCQFGGDISESDGERGAHVDDARRPRRERFGQSRGERLRLLDPDAVAAIARAIAAWSKSLNSAANGPEPCSTQPSALLLKTTVTIGMSCSIAVIIPFIVIAKPPSPTTATTGRSGWTSLAASAAGMPNPIGPEPAACRNPSGRLVW